MVYGRPPPVIPNYIPGTTSIEAVDSTLLSRDSLLDNLQANLLKAMKSKKIQADKRRFGLSFDIGDWVYLTL